jgi:hypothetical protein
LFRRDIRRIRRASWCTKNLIFRRLARPGLAARLTGRRAAGAGPTKALTPRGRLPGVEGALRSSTATLISVFGAESDVSIHSSGNSGLHRSNAVRCGGCSCLEYPKIVDLPIAETPETTPAGTGRDLLFPGERRRPDRIEHVDPELIPLLGSDKIAKAGTHDDEQDPLRAARGVAVRGRRAGSPSVCSWSRRSGLELVGFSGGSGEGGIPMTLGADRDCQSQKWPYIFGRSL